LSTEYPISISDDASMSPDDNSATNATILRILERMLAIIDRMTPGQQNNWTWTWLCGAI